MDVGSSPVFDDALVPSLLIDQEKLPENVTAHVGTPDLD
jgi:hypothetical protein